MLYVDYRPEAFHYARDAFSSLHAIFIRLAATYTEFDKNVPISCTWMCNVFVNFYPVKG